MSIISTRRAAASLAVLAAALGTVATALPAAAATSGTTLTGVVWFDRNANGVKDASEPAFKETETVVLQKDGKIVGFYDTDSDGRYTITGLAPGDYRVGNAWARPWAETTPSGVALTLSAGEQSREVNFGMRGGSVSGVIWQDTNGDGVRQASEKTVAPKGSEVVLYGSSDSSVKMSVKVGADGRYRFDDLQEGEFFVNTPDLDQTASGHVAIDTNGSTINDVVMDLGYELNKPAKQAAPVKAPAKQAVPAAEEVTAAPTTSTTTTAPKADKKTETVATTDLAETGTSIFVPLGIGTGLLAAAAVTLYLRRRGA